MLLFSLVSEDRYCQREQKISCIDFCITSEVRRSRAFDLYENGAAYGEVSAPDTRIYAIKCDCLQLTKLQ
jgi:hypothetical protein